MDSDCEVIDAQKSTNHTSLAGEREHEANEGEAANEHGAPEPQVGMKFDSAYAARTFYDEYARHMGFTTKLGPAICSKVDGSFTARDVLCSKEGSKISPQGCDAMIRVELQAGKWVITKFTKEHGHLVSSPMVSPDRVHHKPHRNFAALAKKVAENSPEAVTAPKVGTVPSRVLDVSVDGNRINPEANGSAVNAPLNFAQGISPRSAMNATLVRNSGTINHAHNMNAHRTAKNAPSVSNSGTVNHAQGINREANRSAINRSQSINREANHSATDSPLVSNPGIANHSHSINPEANRSAVNPGPINFAHHIIPETNRSTPNDPIVSNFGTMNYAHHVNLETNCSTTNVPPVSNPSTMHSGASLFNSAGPMNYAFPFVNNAGTVNYSARPMNRKRTLGRDAQNLLQYLKKMQAENPGFFYAVQVDENNCLVNVFWADARSRAAYSHFSDVVTLDTTYKVYQYKVPFAPFTGVNHHSQTILFGCALLLDESEASFVWLFKTFLTAMNDQSPMSIITDQDRAIQGAVSIVFPGARHCISKWHVFRDGQEKLAQVCLAHHDFELELYNCINLTETIEEFELSWNSILDKYDLRRNDWLQSLYNVRVQWAPAYFRNSFFAAVFPNQGFEGSFFDGYVNQQTTLPTFFRQYERALDSYFAKEIEADFDTICTAPVLKTPSPMEKQAANLYTRKLFAKFQDELVETFVYTANRIEDDGVISTFRVAKFEDYSRAYTVTLNYSEMTANCSCQMFEYSGLLCRHVLTVFTVTNVLTLPSHYILKRWTRNAKSGPAFDDRAVEQECQESLTVRYNNLCREATRCVEEGATTLETYNASIAALREVRKKISVVKKNVAKVAPQSSGVGMSSSDVTPLLWPRQDETNRRSNLNDATQCVGDFNLPSMAPVSVNRDDGPPDSTIALPYLKSMTWSMEKKDSAPGNKVAVINLKLQDYSKASSTETEVKFQLTRVTLEPMLNSMTYISEQLLAPANKVAVINMKLPDTGSISGESDIKFQVSRDTLGAMLRSMAYIREQLSVAVVEPQIEPAHKRQRK